MTTTKTKPARARPTHQSATRTKVLRVRLTPEEERDLLIWVDEGDVSEYVRLALRRYRDVTSLALTLDEDRSVRALTTFECNLLATVNPEIFLEFGGAELTKPPTERRKSIA